MKNAVFLDRDGNINRDVGYPASFESIHIYPYSFEAVNKLNSAGLLAVIITNQSGIGRGLIKEQNLQKIHKQMIQAFSVQNARIDGIYYCPHYTHSLDPKYKKDCSCRKPNPEMALKAAKDLNIDLSGSYMVGDKVDDLLFLTEIGRLTIDIPLNKGHSDRQVQTVFFPETHNFDILARFRKTTLERRRIEESLCFENNLLRLT